MKINELDRFRFLILGVLVFLGGLSEGSAQFKGSGTGFFVTSKGHIVTNLHVVENHPDLAIITQNDELYTAKLKATNKDLDLAVLEIIGFEDGEVEFPYLDLGDSYQAKLGDPVLTIGFPNIDLQGVSPKLSSGEISSLKGFRDEIGAFQISNPLQPGNSGGALVTENGQVIGVIRSKLTKGENVAYAIKSSKLSAVLELADPIGEILDEQEAPNIEGRAEAIEHLQKTTCLILAGDVSDQTAKEQPSSAGTPKPDSKTAKVDPSTKDPDSIYNIVITNTETRTKHSGKAALWWGKKNVYGGYRLKGIDTNYMIDGRIEEDGSMTIREITKGKVSASGRLTMRTINEKSVWLGTLANTADNRRFLVTMTKLQ
jgi:hypothetical protein